jgi:hypothetical protein
VLTGRNLALNLTTSAMGTAVGLSNKRLRPTAT